MNNLYSSFPMTQHQQLSALLASHVPSLQQPNYSPYHSLQFQQAVALSNLLREKEAQRLLQANVNLQAIFAAQASLQLNK